jgi:hypothetical protein
VIPTTASGKYTGNVGLDLPFILLRLLMYIVGAMAGYHAALAIHPGTSYGVAVLLGGHYPDAAKIAYDIFELFQPAMDRSLAELAKSMYAGKWASPDGQSSATVLVHKGSLYIENMNINGTDILPMFHSPDRVALRSTHHDKFRCVQLLLLLFQFSSQKKDGFAQVGYRNSVL